MTAYHASGTHLGETFTFTDGGHYEANENGIVQQRRAAGEFCGFETSDVPELAASKTPEAAVFAKAKNLAEGSGNTSTVPVTISVYELDRAPDVDLTNTIAGDFSFIEEVRYRHPGTNPVGGDLYHTVTLPSRVLHDIDLAYLPPGPHIIEEWATTDSQEQHQTVGSARKHGASTEVDQSILFLRVIIQVCLLSRSSTAKRLPPKK
jgi:hypothetical protein